jgi:myo-inositol-1(or 4)-monophosphatase
VFDHECGLAEELLRRGGNVLLQMRGQPVEITTKQSLSDVVTGADIASEAAMLALLAAESPDDGVLSEEAGFEPGRSGNDVWVIDPLDGTVNYLSGLDGFGVIVGLTRHGVPTVGGMYLPVTGDLYLAARGQGATLNGQRVHVSSTTRIEDAVIDHSLSGAEPVLEAQDRTLRALLRHARALRSTHSLEYLARVAKGTCDGFVYHSLGLWDICGPSVVLEEAGATVVGLAGGALDLSPTPAAPTAFYAAIAANPDLVSQILSAIGVAQ